MPCSCEELKPTQTTAGVRSLASQALFSDDTKLAQTAQLSMFWRHLCWDQKVLFRLLESTGTLRTFRDYYQLAQLNVILELLSSCLLVRTRNLR